MLVYLAGPYSHEDPEVRQFRFDELTCYATMLKFAGWDVFSPITHSHPMHKIAPALAINFKAWKDLGETILKVSDALVILGLEGWNTSEGVLEETKIALREKIPITNINWDPSHTYNPPHINTKP